MNDNKGFSYAEVWDDSELVSSWNDALEEYKHYHSLHARGEKVEDVLRATDEADSNANELHVEDGEVDEVHDEHGDTGLIDMEDNHKESLQKSSINHNKAPELSHNQNVQPGSVPSLVTMPQTLLQQGSDETLKNLLMSWYYAGYYTGLHEGQQNALRAQESSKQSGVEQNAQSTGSKTA